MDHTKSLKREHRLHNIIVPEFRYIRAARLVSLVETLTHYQIQLSFHFKRLLFEFVERNGTLIATG